MVPSNLIYWYTIATMGNTVFLHSLFLSKIPNSYLNLPIDISTVLQGFAAVITMVLDGALIGAYRQKKTRWTFWICLVNLCILNAFAPSKHNVSEDTRKILRYPKWALPIIITLTTFFSSVLRVGRTLWLTTYVLKNKLFPILWTTFEKYQNNIRKYWYIHLVSNLPTLLLLLIPIHDVASSESNVEERGIPENITLTTLSALQIATTPVVGLSNGLLYGGVRQGRPVLLQLFVVLKWTFVTACLSLFVGIKDAKSNVSGTMTLCITAMAVCATAELLFASFYHFKLVDGWIVANDNKSWNVEAIPLRCLTGIQTEPLGNGHTSTVYRCLLTLKRKTSFSKLRVSPAALKHFHIRDTDSICQEFANLSRIAKLKHVNVVRFYGVCVEDQMVCAVFELCDRGSLKGFLNRLKIETGSTNLNINDVLLQQLAVWSAEIAAGMEFLSTNGIIHGDLAARNVLLSSNLTAKISDFGLSHKLYGRRVYERLDQTAVLPWKWMAPEVLTDCTVQKESDVWSYGITLWEIYSLGEEPWQEYQWDSHFASILQNGTRLTWPNLASDAFYQQCLMSCWKFVPAERPSFAELRDLLCLTTFGSNHNG